MIKKAWDWLVVSSADPAKLSLTLKSGIPAVLLILGWAHFGQQVDANLLGEGADAVANFLALLAQVATSAVAVYGFGRKLYNTLKTQSA